MNIGFNNISFKKAYLAGTERLGINPKAFDSKISATAFWKDEEERSVDFGKRSIELFEKTKDKADELIASKNAKVCFTFNNLCHSLCKSKFSTVILTDEDAEPLILAEKNGSDELLNKLMHEGYEKASTSGDKLPV